MNELAKTNTDLITVLQNSLYPDAQPESIQLVLSYCKHAGLDPMQKPVHIVPMWSSKTRQMRDVIMPGIGLYRVQAARTGQFAGLSEPEYGPTLTETLGGQSVTFPEWCKITVTRMAGGLACRFTAKEYWKENYATKGGQEKSIAPNAMWARRPFAQLAKCAEAQALRKAFPEVGSQATAEEMEGKYYDAPLQTVQHHQEIDRGLPNATQSTESIESYPDRNFAKNANKWHEMILAGKKTAADIKAMLATKGFELTAEQLETIQSWEKQDD